MVPRASCEVPDAVRQALLAELRSGFVNLASEWVLFRDQILHIDEIWEFDGPAEYWDPLCGSSGIALVRDQKVISEITCEMN